MTAASYIYRSEIRSNTPFGLIIVRKEIAWKKHQNITRKIGKLVSYISFYSILPLRDYSILRVTGKISLLLLTVLPS